jgi:WD40 repeat protein
VIYQEPTLVGGLDWTPSGGELVFSSSRSGSPRLWRISLGEREPRALSLGEDSLLSNATGAEAIGEVSNPFRVSIARHGERLAYTRSFYDTNIWRAPADGQGPAPGARLIASTQLEEAPQYSPDGRRIAFSSTRGTVAGEIWVCESDGSGCFQLTALGHSCGTPRWSPDGGQVAFDAAAEGHGDVYAIDVETRVPRRLTHTSAEEAVPSWSRDGRWIYFASDRSGSWQVWRMLAEGGTAVQVTRGGGFAAFETVASHLAGLWAHAAHQPFEYPLRREYVEPDWTRLPGYADVTTEQWESAQWQRAHTVKNLKEFKEALGDFLDDDLMADIERDQQERATMSMLIPPQMINTMEEHDLRNDRDMVSHRGREERR